MDRKRFDDQPCPIAQATNIFGDWWVPMILRETMYGANTFSEFQEKLGISRNILNQRLKMLVEKGIFEKELYQKPSRYRYNLTDKGKAGLSILAVMADWANEFLFDEQTRPINLVNTDTGQIVKPGLVDTNTGQPLEFSKFRLEPGPGFPESKEVRQWRFGSVV